MLVLTHLGLMEGERSGLGLHHYQSSVTFEYWFPAPHNFRLFLPSFLSPSSLSSPLRSSSLRRCPRLSGVSVRSSKSLVAASRSLTPVSARLELKSRASGDIISFPRLFPCLLQPVSYPGPHPLPPPGVSGASFVLPASFPHCTCLPAKRRTRPFSSFPSLLPIASRAPSSRPRAHNTLRMFRASSPGTGMGAIRVFSLFSRGRGHRFPALFSARLLPRWTYCVSVLSFSWSHLPSASAVPSAFFFPLDGRFRG